MISLKRPASDSSLRLPQRGNTFRQFVQRFTEALAWTLTVRFSAVNRPARQFRPVDTYADHWYVGRLVHRYTNLDQIAAAKGNRSMPRKVRVSTASFHRQMTASVEGNRAFALTCFEAAGAEQADLLCLPETLLEIGLPRAERPYVESISGPTIDAFSALAKQHRLWAVAPLSIHSDAGIIENMAVVIDRNVPCPRPIDKHWTFRYRRADDGERRCAPAIGVRPCVSPARSP